MAAQPTPPGASVRAQDAMVTLLAIAVGALLVSRVVFAHPPYELWADRDLYRAGRVWQDWPTAGAEMNHGSGARVPGGLYLWAMALPHALGIEGVGLYRLLMGAEGLAIAALGWSLARVHGPVAGLVAAAAAAAPREAREATAWLWNPTFVVPVVSGATAMLVRGVQGDDRRWLGAWGLLLGFGATAHATVVAWWFWSVVGLAVVRPRWSLRRSPWLLGGFGLAFLPFVVGEVWGGGDHLALLQQQSVLSSDHVQVVAWRLGDVATSVSWLMPVDRAGWWWLWGPACLLLALGGAGSAVWPWRTSDGVAVSAGLATLMAVLVPALDARLQIEHRYVLAAIPGFSLLVGLGSAWVLGRVATGRRGWMGCGLLAPWVVLLALTLATERRPPRGPDPTAHRSLAHRMAVFGDVSAWTGWSLAEITGRLVVLDAQDGAWAVSGTSAVDHELDHSGDVFQGSAPPPCVAIGAGVDALTPGALAAALGVPPDEVGILDTIQLPSGPSGLRYTLAGGRCPTVMSNRYVDTPTEARMRPHWSTLGDGDVVALPGDPPLWLVRIHPGRDDGVSLLLGLTVTREGDQLVATLHSNQLRGRAYNAGWFQDGGLRQAQLTLVDATGTETVLPLYAGVLGPSHVATPLRVAVPAPPAGTYGVRLEGTALGVSSAAVPWRERIREEVAVQAVLSEAWVWPPP